MTTAMSTMTTVELRERLQRHYIKLGVPLPGGIFLPEVGWNGGQGRGGCDAIYVGFTSASGRLLVGHELKVSRADWLAELRRPGKADAWADQCHQWWLVVSDPAIVHDGELPAGWGLMSPGTSKTRMKVQVAAATKHDHTPSWAAVRSILARYDTLRAEAIIEGRRRAEEAVRADICERVEREVARSQDISPEVEHARELVGAINRRHHHLPGDMETLADEVCAALDNRRYANHVRSLQRERLRALNTATAALERSWQYRELRRLLDEDGAEQ